MKTILPAPQDLPCAKIAEISDYQEWMEKLTTKLKEHPFSCTDSSVIIVGNKNDKCLFQQANNDLFQTKWSVFYMTIGWDIPCLIISHPSFLPKVRAMVS